MEWRLDEAAIVLNVTFEKIKFHMARDSSGPIQVADMLVGMKLPNPSPPAAFGPISTRLKNKIKLVRSLKGRGWLGSRNSDSDMDPIGTAAAQATSADAEIRVCHGWWGPCVGTKGLMT